MSSDSSELSFPDSIAFIGGGNMARSLIGGLLQGGAPASAIRVSEPNAELREALARDFAVATHADNALVAGDADVWVLAVKPQVMREVCAGLREIAQIRHPLVVSLAAGIRIAQLEKWLNCATAIVRCMPNTPALIGAGASGLCANTHTSPMQRDQAQSILGAAGLIEWIDDEALMDTVTAVSGSGPAYFFLLVEALENAAVAQGLPRESARALAAQTCLGAGRMLGKGDVAPAELRRRVTSPGGTTQAALESFSSDRFDEIVARAVAAATRRGGELSAQLDE
ncbi:MAG TPA: pyrroline-5-carboxylate reductase [Rudaea sp.]|nr:pyrroline-5-carboxylate reductase [Rudaea sp.]